MTVRGYPKVMAEKNGVKSESDVSHRVSLDVSDERGEQDVGLVELSSKRTVGMRRGNRADWIGKQRAQCIDFGKDMIRVGHERCVAPEAAEVSPVRPNQCPDRIGCCHRAGRPQSEVTAHGAGDRTVARRPFVQTRHARANVGQIRQSVGAVATDRANRLGDHVIESFRCGTERGKLGSHGAYFVTETSDHLVGARENRVPIMKRR